MKKINFLPAILGIVMITSCGPSAAEIEAKNKATADSIAIVAAEKLKMVEDSIAKAKILAEEEAVKAQARLDSAQKTLQQGLKNLGF